MHEYNIVDRRGPVLFTAGQVQTGATACCLLCFPRLSCRLPMRVEHHKVRRSTKTILTRRNILFSLDAQADFIQTANEATQQSDCVLKIGPTGDVEPAVARDVIEPRPIGDAL